MIKRCAAAFLVALGLTLGAAAPPPAADTAAKPVASSAAPTATPVAGDLTKQDVDTWLDGFMPYALASGDIAGAVVVVVKDGQVLTERGFGHADVATGKPVDPARTLFRPGSVSKLFTWTAVMQQVQAGKLNLDQDINTYLDFKIPPYKGQPITLRALMTHTPGFSDNFKDTFLTNPKELTSLGDYVSHHIPARIYPPRTTPAYSNYGATLAAYIVQRVSGEPFNDYVARHIFQPLGMNHSSFVQPLPAALVPDMSSGYLQASQPPKPYELVNIGPAGSLTTSGDDMSRFMIAMLNHGQYGAASILDPQTVTQMQTQQDQFDPPLPGMALGFYHEDRNGLSIVGHAGDTNYFHSDLHLILGKNVGLFISLNSLGKAGAAEALRVNLFRDFLDRYYPVAAPHLPTAPTAKADAKTVTGLYWFSRRVTGSFFDLLNLLGQAKVTADAQGNVKISDLVDAARAPEVWREVAPFHWVDRAGGNLVAVVKDGKVVQMATDDLPPVMQLMPVPAYRAASWNVPLFYAMIGVLVLMLVLWPIQVLVRRRYGGRFELIGRRAVLYRGTRIAAIVQLGGLVAYLVLISLLAGGAASPSADLDPMQTLAQVLCALGVVGALVELANLVTAWSGEKSSWWTKVSTLAVCLAGVAYVWFVVTLHLVTFSLAY